MVLLALYDAGEAALDHAFAPDDDDAAAALGQAFAPDVAAGEAALDQAFAPEVAAAAMGEMVEDDPLPQALL